MSARGKLRIGEGSRIGFWCPGCKTIHWVDGSWKFNGNYDSPTITPSVAVTSGHYVADHTPGSACWCTYNAEHPDKPAPFRCERCHSIITDGAIAYCADSTHALSGQTVPMVDPTIA